MPHTPFRMAVPSCSQSISISIFSRVVPISAIPSKISGRDSNTPLTMLIIICAPVFSVSFRDEIRFVSAGFTSIPFVSAMAKLVRLVFMLCMEWLKVFDMVA